MIFIFPRGDLSQDDVMQALVARGEDPTPSRASAVLERANATKASGVDRDQAVRAAVDSACAVIDAPSVGAAGMAQGPALDHVVLVYGALGNRWLTESGDESPYDLETTMDPAIANRYNNWDEANAALLQAVERHPANSFRVDTLPAMGAPAVLISDAQDESGSMAP